MKHGDFIATEVLRFTEQEINEALEQVRKSYENAKISHIYVFDDNFAKRTGDWYSVQSSLIITVKIFEQPLIYKAFNGKRISDFNEIKITISKHKGNTNDKNGIIQYSFRFRNNGTMNRGIFEINPHYFYDDDIKALNDIIKTYNNALIYYLPDSSKAVYIRRNIA